MRREDVQVRRGTIRNSRVWRVRREKEGILRETLVVCTRIKLEAQRSLAMYVKTRRNSPGRSYPKLIEIVGEESKNIDVGPEGGSIELTSGGSCQGLTCEDAIEKFGKA
jgi:hypothetical protein